jgi:hypothetical protein
VRDADVPDGLPASRGAGRGPLREGRVQPLHPDPRDQELAVRRTWQGRRMDCFGVLMVPFVLLGTGMWTGLPRAWPTSLHQWHCRFAPGRTL